MTFHSPENYRRWFEYEKDSHAKVVASLASVSDALQSTEGYQKAVDLLAHMAAARRLWLFRFGAAQEKPAEIFPRHTSLPKVALCLEEMHQVWSDYLSQLNETELARVFEYQSYEGDWYRNTIEDILTQLFGHSWYHRGQIAALVRSIGAEPAVTDFVFWAREPIPLKE